MISEKNDVNDHVQRITQNQTEDDINLSSYYIARSYFHAGDYESAKDYVSRYLKVREESADAHKLLGQILEALEQKEAGLAKEKQGDLDLKDESSADPTDAMFHINILRYYINMQKFEMAYKHALHVEQNHNFENNVLWTRAMCELLGMCKMNNGFNLEFWRLYACCLERLVVLTVKVQSDSEKTVPKETEAVFNFRQGLAETEKHKRHYNQGWQTSGPFRSPVWPSLFGNPLANASTPGCQAATRCGAASWPDANTGSGATATTSSGFHPNSSITTCDLFGANTQAKPFGAGTQAPLFGCAETTQTRTTGFGADNTTGFGANNTIGFGSFGGQNTGSSAQDRPAFNMPTSTARTVFGNFEQNHSTGTSAGISIGANPARTTDVPIHQPIQPSDNDIETFRIERNNGREVQELRKEVPTNRLGAGNVSHVNVAVDQSQVILCFSVFKGSCSLFI